MSVKRRGLKNKHGIIRRTDDPTYISIAGDSIVNTILRQDTP